MRTSSRTHLRPALAAALGVLALAVLAPSLAAVTATPITPVPAPQPFCVSTIDPAPTGIVGRPTVSFPALDHQFIHSSVHLQGLPATEKWAGGLLQHPPAASGFDGFSSAVVVDNPDPNVAINFQIDYFDFNGVNVGTSVGTLAPNGHHIEAATPLDPASNPGALGVGSARVTTTADTGIVGAAAAELALDAIGADPPADRRIGSGARRLRGRRIGPHGGGEELSGVAIGGEERLELGGASATARAAASGRGRAPPPRLAERRARAWSTRRRRIMRAATAKKCARSSQRGTCSPPARRR